MIINLRGTSGSGKSTVVTRVMSLFDKRDAVMKERRRQPIGYYLSKTLSDGPWPVTGQRIRLFVPGHYEIACGGCDTISDTQEILNLITKADDAGFHVLCEGIMLQDIALERLQYLAKHRQFLIIGLTTPIATCLEGVQSRRDARGDTRPLDPKNTVNRDRSQRGKWPKLRAAGFEVLELDRDAAFREVAERLGLMTFAKVEDFIKPSSSEPLNLGTPIGTFRTEWRDDEPLPSLIDAIEGANLLRCTDPNHNSDEGGIPNDRGCGNPKCFNHRGWTR